jgi:hypothetical protein
MFLEEWVRRHRQCIDIKGEYVGWSKQYIWFYSFWFGGSRDANGRVQHPIGQETLILKCHLCPSEKPEATFVVIRWIGSMGKSLSFIPRIFYAVSERYSFREFSLWIVIGFVSSMIAVFVNPFKCLIDEILLVTFLSLKQMCKPGQSVPSEKCLDGGLSRKYHIWMTSARSCANIQGERRG